MVAPDLDCAIRVTDKLAPEHLELQVADADAVWRRLSNYGGLFIGTNTAEVFGDYGAGPNHVLPTSGTARYTGGLSVFTFLVRLVCCRGVVSEAPARMYFKSPSKSHARSSKSPITYLPFIVVRAAHSHVAALGC